MSVIDALRNIGTEETAETAEMVTVAHAMALDYLSEENDIVVDASMEIDQIESAMEIMEHVMESMALHMGTFKSAIADGGVTKQTYNAVVMQLQHDCRIIGQEFVSMDTESLDEVGGRLRVTDETIASISKTFKKGMDRAVELYDAMVDAVVKFYKRHVTSLGRFGKKVEALVKVSGELKGAVPSEAKVQYPEALFIGTKPAKFADLTKVVKLIDKYSKNKELVNSLKDIAGTIEAATVASDAEALASANAIKDSVASFGKVLEESLDITETPKDLNKKQLPDETEYETIRTTEVMPGNFVVLLALAGDKTSRVPAIKVLPTNDKLPKDREEDALSVAEIQSYTSLCQELLTALTAIAEGYDPKPAEAISKATKALYKKLKDADLSESAAEEIQSRVKQIRGLGKLVREPSASLVSRFSSVGTGMYNIAYNSAKQVKE